jgi:nucleotidyltransferase substrate binding protein (TIGR01987 family)
MFIGSVNVLPLLRAFKKFELFRVNDATEQEKAGTIHAFKYCFEHVWDVMKRLLDERGKVVNSPREAFRTAALEGFITDPEIWFDFLKKRNATVHTYQEDEIARVLSVCPAFSVELKTFLENIGVNVNEQFPTN